MITPFSKLVSEDDRVRALLQPNCIDAGYHWWRAHRRLIAGAIDKPGSILDVGCANGFFTDVPDELVRT